MFVEVPTQEEARLQIADALEIPAEECRLTREVTLEEFNAIGRLGRDKEWPLKPGAGPSWVYSCTLQDFLSQYAFL